MVLVKMTLETEDFPRPEFNDEGYENLRRSQAISKPIDDHSVTNVISESISSIWVWDILNQVSMSFLMVRYTL